MKRKLLLSLLGIVIGLPIWGQEIFFLHTYMGNTLQYHVLDETERTCEVVPVPEDWYLGDFERSSEVILPEYVTDDTNLNTPYTYTLTRIGDRAFKGFGVSSITIPNTVTSIGNEAFANTGYSSGISSFDIPDSVTEIGENILYRNFPQELRIGRGLKVVPTLGVYEDDWRDTECMIHLTFYEGLREFKDPGLLFQKSNVIDIMIDDIDNWANTAPEGYHPYETIFNPQVFPDFLVPVTVTLNYKGKPVTDVTLGNKVERVGPYAFAYIGLEKVTFSSYVTEICEGAFASANIPEAKLPEGMTSIGAKAFYNCQNLSEVTLPSTVESICEAAFKNDISLYEVTLPKNLKTLGASCFEGCIDLETASLNEGLVEIGNKAFYNCNRLNLPKIPTSTEVIGDYAFYGKIYTGDLNFGTHLKSLGNYAFAFPETWSEEGYFVEAKAGDVLTVRLPNSLINIGAYAFSRQPIREIILPSNLEYLGEGALSYTRISSLAIPSSLTEISNYACANMAQLTSVTLPDGIDRIGDYAFSNSPVGKLVFPSTLTSIGAGAFEGSSLINCEIPEGVTSIGSQAFYNSGLNNCSMPNSVTEIGEKVFSDINYVTLGNGIKSITNQIAENISVLEMKSATPPTLTNNRLGFTPNIVIVPEGAGDTYKNNNRWKDFNISARNSNKATVYISDPGTLATELRIQTGIMPALVTNLTVEGTLNDDDFAVMRSNMTSCYEIDMSGLTNKSIPANAFAGKNTLLEITLPSETEEIGENAFINCSVLHLSSIPTRLKKIDAGAFNGCTSMNNAIKFPASLKTVGYGAFYNCWSLKSADFSACSDVDFNSEVFNACYSLEWVTLPAGMTSIPNATFKGAGVLSVNLPSSLQTIESEAFAYSGLQSVDIPEGVSSIEDNAFNNTASLEYVNFPSTLNSIGYAAFERSDLSGAVLPAALNSMGERAFAHSSISYVTFMGGLTTIPASAFEGCPYLMIVNLPNTLSAINDKSFACSNISSISSPTIEPAMTFGAPFNGVDNYTCALSIPKSSYSKYLSAEYWGAFVGIRNCIDVTFTDGLKLGTMNEDDFQNMTEDAETNAELPTDVRRRALHAIAREGKAKLGKVVSRLFNNASVFVEDNATMRYFLIDVPEWVDDLVIKYNSRDITSELDKETMSFVCPPLTSSSTLVIESQKLSGVETVAGEGEIAADAPVFDLTGVVVGHGPEALKNLPAGIYIVAGKKIAVK